MSTDKTLFISYRRSDSREESRRIKDAVSTYFGKEFVFIDEDAIPASVDFRKSIKDAIKNCVAMIVVIGKNWLDASDSSGHRRLDDAEDYVRIELETALSRYVPIYPVLLADASMPSSDQLPTAFSKL